MNHESSDGRGAGHEDGARGRERDSGRVIVLARASAAIRLVRPDGDGASGSLDGHGSAQGSTSERAVQDAERHARTELEAEVRRYAARLRSEGAPPEIAVRQLKAAVEPVVFSPREHDGTDVEWRRTVVGDVVRWFVEAYYAV